MQAADPATIIDAPPKFTHQQILRVLSGILLCIFLAAIDQTVVIPAVPGDRRRPERLRASRLDRLGLSADLHGDDADLRQAVRHLRPAKAAAGGAGGVRGRLGAVRAGRQPRPSLSPPARCKASAAPG